MNTAARIDAMRAVAPLSDGVSTWKTVGSAAITVLLMSTIACAPGGNIFGGNVPNQSALEQPNETKPVVDPALPTDFSPWLSQTLEWEECQVIFECATIKAPLNWGDPGAGSIDIALKMRPASGERIGSLLLNPGGPGMSGVDAIPNFSSRFGLPVREAFDIIGFDPRGVGLSTPVVCLDDADLDFFLSRDFSDDSVGQAELVAANAEFAASCAQNTDPLLGQVDTASVAQDMELIRHLLGEETLNYFGFSWGTALGATYAGLFPERVGRMVLDAGIDITLTAEQRIISQAQGFENALRSYVADCQQREGCPLSGSVDDGLAQISELFDQVLAEPLPTRQSNRPLTRSLAIDGVTSALYEQSSWLMLTHGLTEAIVDGRGDTLLTLADFLHRRNPDGTFSSDWQNMAFAVRCLDERPSTNPAVVAATKEEIITVAPTFSRLFTRALLACQDWPYPAVVSDFDPTAPGSPPILVIGTTGDSSTPYEMSVALANTLENGVLLTWVGEGHTAYLAGSRCITNTVDAFLVSGVVPELGTQC